MNSITESHLYLHLFSIRRTVHREAIINYLLKNRIHPTIDDIYLALKETIPTLSKITIYNSLELFIRHGAAQLLQIGKENMRYDIETDKHAHFFCKTCGAVHNIESLDSSIFVLPKNKNCAIFTVEILYTGVCDLCK